MALFRTPYKKVVRGKETTRVTLEKYHELYGEECEPCPEIPEGGARIWELFWEIAQARPQGFDGPLALPASEILAWCTLSNNALRPIEFDLLRRMDSAWLSGIAKVREIQKAEDQ